MPIYEYECSQCASRYEVKRGFHEVGGDACPECGGAGQQIFSPTPSIYKCGGFYITENRKNSERHGDVAQPAKAEAEKSEKKSDAIGPKAKVTADNPTAKNDSGTPAPVKPVSS